MNLSYGVLSLLACLAPNSWHIGSATTLFTAINDIGFSAALFLVDRGIVFIRRVDTGKGREKRE
jgi:hypothetical protein